MEDSLHLMQVREAVKMALKRRGATYSDLGKVLGLTLPGVKRLMTKGDLSLSRLELIAQWCGLTLFELMEAAKVGEPKPYEFTEAQEVFLSRNPEALYLLLLLGAALPLEECYNRAKFSKKKMEKLLYALDKNNFIELRRENKFRILARGPFQGRNGGELRKRFQGQYLRKLSQLLTSNVLEDDLRIPYELYMSERLFDQMKVDLLALYSKYRGLTRLEHELHSGEKIFPVSGVILAMRYDSWRAVLIDTVSEK